MRPPINRKHRLRRKIFNQQNLKERTTRITRNNSKRPNQHSESNRTLKSRPSWINETNQQMNRETRTVTGSFQKMRYYDMKHFVARRMRPPINRKHPERKYPNELNHKEHKTNDFSKEMRSNQRNTYK